MPLDLTNLPEPLTGCEDVLRATPRYLELLDPDHRDYDPRFLSIVRRKAGLEEGPDPIVIHADESVGRMAAARPSVADQLRLQRLVKKCDDRDTSVPCGCGMAICKQNKGTGIDRSRVSLRECMACVEARETASPASPPTGS